MVKKLTYVLIGALLTALAAFGLTGCKDDDIKSVYFGGDIKKEYVRNDVIDLSDLYITIVYKDGKDKSYPLPYKDVTVTGGDTSVAGENLSLTVSYKKCKKTFTYSVRNPKLTLDFGNGAYEEKTSMEISAENNYTDVSGYLPTPDIWGYEFAGWFYDREFTSPVKYYFGSGRIDTSSDITVYAGYDLSYSDKFVYEENSDGQIVLTGLQNEMLMGFGELYIPETIKLRPVVKINDGFVDPMFVGMMNYSSLRFADNSKVTEIGNEAFSGLFQLKEIDLPSGLRRIGKDAFSGVGITSIVIPASVESLGENAFFSGQNLVSVEFEENSKLNFIGASAFSYCSGLSSINLPESLVTLSPYAFNFCTNLEEVYVGKNVKQIGFHAFASCSRLMAITISPENAGYKTIDGNVYSKDETTFVRYCFGKNEEEFTLKSGVTSIYESAFDATELNHSLKILNLPDTLTHINDYAFKELDAELTIPASVSYLSNNALTYYWGKEFKVDENNACYTVKDGVVYSKDFKTLVSIPVNANMTEFVLDQRTEVIATGAFIGNKTIKYFVVPKNSALKTIRKGAYLVSGTTNLCGFYFENSVPAEIEEKAFNDKASVFSSSVSFYVREDCKDAYVSKWNNVLLDANQRLSDRIVVVSGAYANALGIVKEKIGLDGDVTLRDFTAAAEDYVNRLMLFVSPDTNVYAMFSELFLSLDSAYRAADYVSADNYVNDKELDYIKVFEKTAIAALTDFYTDAEDAMFVRQTSFYRIKEHYDNLPSAISDELTLLEDKFDDILSRTDEIILKQKNIVDTANELVADNAKNFDLVIAEKTYADYEVYGTLLISLRWSDFINIIALHCSVLINDFIDLPKDPDHYRQIKSCLNRSFTDSDLIVFGIEDYLGSYFKAPLLRKKLYRYNEFASVYEEYLATDKDRIILETNEAVKDFDLVNFDIDAARNVFNNYDKLDADEKNFDYLDKFYDIIFRINVSDFISMEITDDNYALACDFANEILSNYRDCHESSLLSKEDDAKIDSQSDLLFSLFEQRNAEFVAEIKKIEKNPSVADVHKFYRLYEEACNDLIAPYYPVKLTDDNGEYETNVSELYSTLMIIQIKKQLGIEFDSITTEDDYNDFSDWIYCGYIETDDETGYRYVFKGINNYSYYMTARCLNVFQNKLLTEEEIAKYNGLIEQFNNFFGQGEDSDTNYD